MLQRVNKYIPKISFKNIHERNIKTVKLNAENIIKEQGLAKGKNTFNCIKTTIENHGTHVENCPQNLLLQ